MGPRSRRCAAMSNVRYRQIVRNYERLFPHKVRLPNCRSWRMGYVDAQIAYLRGGQQTAWWHVGDERKGEDFGVYGFYCPVHAAVLTDWSRRCGIDWSIPPDQQKDRPTGPAQAPWINLEPARARDPNLHSLAGTGRPLGVMCKTCGHRALIPLDRLGAHSGNMKEVKSLRLK